MKKTLQFHQNLPRLDDQNNDNMMMVKADLKQIEAVAHTTL